jgi:hypothetical protein
MFKINNYYSDIDEEFSLLEKALDIGIAKANVAYEYVNGMLEVSMMESDLTVLSESGDYEYLSILYEEGSDAADEKKKGIITSMMDTIGNFIKGLFDKIRGKVSDKQLSQLENDPNAPKQVKMEGDDEKSINKFSGVLKAIGDFIKPGFTKTDAEGNKSFDLIKTMITSAEAAMVGAAGYISVKKVGGIKKGWESLLNKANELRTQIKNLIPNAKGDQLNKLQQAGQWISAVTKDFGKKNMGIVGLISGLFKGKGGNSDEESTENPSSNETTSTTDAAPSTKETTTTASANNTANKKSGNKGGNKGGKKKSTEETVKESVYDLYDYEDFDYDIDSYFD